MEYPSNGQPYLVCEYITALVGLWVYHSLAWFVSISQRCLVCEYILCHTLQTHHKIVWPSPLLILDLKLQGSFLEGMSKLAAKVGMKMMALASTRWTSFGSFLRSHPWSSTEPGPRHPCAHRNISETSQNNRGPAGTHLKHIWNIPKQLEVALILLGMAHFLHPSNWLFVLPQCGKRFVQEVFFSSLCALLFETCISSKNVRMTGRIVRLGNKCKTFVPL